MKTQEQIIAELKKATAWMAGLIFTMAIIMMILFIICYKQGHLIDQWSKKNVQVFHPRKIIVSAYIDSVWIKDTTIYDTLKYKIR